MQTKFCDLPCSFHDTGKPASKTADENGRDHFKGHSLGSERIAKNVLRRLKLDNDTIEQGDKAGLLA